MDGQAELACVACSSQLVFNHVDTNVACNLSMHKYTGEQRRMSDQSARRPGKLET